MTPTDPNQDEINEIIGLTERKIRDLMNILAVIVFNKIIDKTSGQFETFFPCHRKSLIFKGFRFRFCSSTAFILPSVFSLGPETLENTEFFCFENKSGTKWAEGK